MALRCTGPRRATWSHDALRWRLPRRYCAAAIHSADPAGVVSGAKVRLSPDASPAATLAGSRLYSIAARLSTVFTALTLFADRRRVCDWLRTAGLAELSRSPLSLAVPRCHRRQHEAWLSTMLIQLQLGNSLMFNRWALNVRVGCNE